MAATVKQRPDNPMERTRGHADAAEPGAMPPLTLDESLTVEREKVYAWAHSYRFYRWLDDLAWMGGACWFDAAGKIQWDTATLRSIDVFGLWHEAAMLIAAGAWAHGRDPEAIDEDAGRVTESEAIAAGLTIYRRPPRRRLRRVAALPGCAGAVGPCSNLRVAGRKYCPACEEIVLAELRSET